MVITREMFDPAIRWANFMRWLAELRGERCLYHEHESHNCEGPLVEVAKMTCYPDEPDLFLACQHHADRYVEHWTEMWREYEAGLL